MVDERVEQVLALTGGREGERPVVDLRDLMGQLGGAVRQVARAGTPEQQAAAAATLAEARKSIYLLLAEGPSAPGE